MREPYEVLGVSKTATPAKIKECYRELAKKLHPDLNPGDAEAETKFKEISAAYDLLSDPEKRGRYDRGEIDASGAERPTRDFYRGYAEGDPGAKYHTQEGFADIDDLEGFMSDMFGAGGGSRAQRGAFRAKGADVTYTLPVSFLEAARGAGKTVTMPDGRTLKISVPGGVRDRQMLRLKGQGMPGYNGGEAGDAFVEVHIQPHALFTRKDNNIHIELPISLNEAILGARISAPTIDGPVALTIPKGSNTDTTLRLKDRGIKTAGNTGHQYVSLKVMLPKEPDSTLTDFIQKWAKDHPYDPRERLSKEGLL